MSEDEPPRIVNQAERLHRKSRASDLHLVRNMVRAFEHRGPMTPSQVEFAMRYICEDGVSADKSRLERILARMAEHGMVRSADPKKSPKGNLYYTWSLVDPSIPDGVFDDRPPDAPTKARAADRRPDDRVRLGAEAVAELTAALTEVASEIRTLRESLRSGSVLWESKD